MKLTGKCKEEFEKWFVKDIDIDEDEFFNNDTMLYLFYAERESMQYGVYVDFFDSVDIFIQIETRIFDKEHPCYIYSKTVYNRVGIFKTRPEARTAAITKANEICNGRN